MIIPVWLAFDWHYPTTVAVYLGLWMTYYGLASAQFYSGNRGWLWIKGVLITVLTQALTMALISGAIWAWYLWFRK